MKNEEYDGGEDDDNFMPDALDDVEYGEEQDPEP